LGFSKKLENLSAAMALYIATYNFTRKHGSLNDCTAAMVAKIVSTLWSFEDLYGEVMALSFKDEKALRTDRCLRMMDRAAYKST